MVLFFPVGFGIIGSEAKESTRFFGGLPGKGYFMDPIKIIFFDVDGTLVDPATGCIPEKTYEALRRLREKGILLCVATGRAPAALPDFDGFAFDGFCTFNGSLCYAGDRVIHSNPIPAEDVAQVLENAAAIGRPVSVATRSRLAANGIDEDLRDYYRLAKLTLTVAEDFETACREDVYQIMLGCREEDHDAVCRGAEGVKIAVSWDRAVDVIPTSSGKGASIGKMLEYFGLDAAQAMAFGDSYNDMDMLQAVGNGVAMGNAPDKLKAIADDVCGPVSRDGIYHYCAARGLI